MVSIVIITCNRLDSLPKTIESCLSFMDHTSELIVVDNGSIDGTREWVTEQSLKNSKIKGVFLPTNLGVAGARNVGFARANGDIVYFIDDDAWIQRAEPGFRDIEKLFSDHPDIAIVGTEIRNTVYHIFEHGVFPKGNMKPSEGIMFNYIGASHFIRKSVFEGRELYPANLFYGAEEHYASLYAWGQGKIVYYYSRFSVVHQPNRKTRINDEEKVCRSYVNLFLCKKLTTHSSVIPVMWVLFLLRVVNMSKGQMGLVKKSLSLYSDVHDDAYRRPMSFVKTAWLVRKFGFVTIL
ncbi:glycosyltransferase family 2 protein [Cohnella silvisoli]|uniref:Glycosyltransferase family 2 protein n=1 Tax=Cohnella silvisoli TaxID=2873699 RepID=A0ABV1KW95_9BACL|nr:glycosyltransferase family 2 protein [Cohnella silvisoli]MCD9023649.1 glycosyltransferase [Cohnella silvisoli]